jgi:hypothetical protein
MRSFVVLRDPCGTFYPQATISSAMTGHELSSLTRYPDLSGMARQAPDL